MQRCFEEGSRNTVNRSKGPGYISVAEHLPSVCKALGLVLNLLQKKERKTGYMESCQSKNFFLVTKQMINKVRQTIAIYKGLQEFNNKTNKTKSKNP